MSQSLPKIEGQRRPYQYTFPVFFDQDPHRSTFSTAWLCPNHSDYGKTWPQQGSFHLQITGRVGPHWGFETRVFLMPEWGALTKELASRISKRTLIFCSHLKLVILLKMLTRCRDLQLLFSFSLEIFKCSRWYTMWFYKSSWLCTTSMLHLTVSINIALYHNHWKLNANSLNIINTSF